MTNVRPYSGIRILDLTHELGSYAGRLFGDLGAEVIRIEAAAGPPDRAAGRGGAKLQDAAAYAFLHAGKKSVRLALDTEGGLDVLSDLLAGAAVVLVETDPDRPAPLERILAAAGPKVVTTLSYFGMTGPFAGFRGSDLIAQSLGGIAWLSGDPDKPPLRLAGEQSRFVTSLYAAAATAIALWDAEERGGRHVLDVSAQECIAHSLQNAIQVYDLEGRISSRGGEGIRDATESIFPCRDGYVSLAAPLALPASWNGLLAWMRDEGFAPGQRLLDPLWQDRPARAKHEAREAFRRIFEGFVADKTRRELAQEALNRKIVMAPVSRVSDLPGDPQLVFRRYFQQVFDRSLQRTVPFPGAPYRLSEPVWAVSGSAPVPGAHDEEILGGAAAVSGRRGR